MPFPSLVFSDWHQANRDYSARSFRSCHMNRRTCNSSCTENQFRSPPFSRVPPLREVTTAAGDLCGTGVSPGTVHGPIRVLRRIEDAALIRPGEIIVVPSLDPAWTAAFARAAGLIAERGAVLSHGAILAREFGVPAVVNVMNATAFLLTEARLQSMVLPERFTWRHR